MPTPKEAMAEFLMSFEDGGVSESPLTGFQGQTRSTPDDDAKRDEFLRSVEDDLLHRSMQTLQNAMRATDIDPDAKEAPKEWADEGLNEAERKKALRTAQAAWMSKKDAPVYLSLASSIAGAITKARSLEKAAPRQLAVALVNFPVSQQIQYPILDVENEK